jgi:hypothetical protein
MSSLAPPKQRRVVRTIGVLLAILVTGALGLGLFVYSRLGARSDGTRLSLVWPGSEMSMVSTKLHTAVAADLAADGGKVQAHGTRGENETMLLVRRERLALLISITAGDQPLDTAHLGYVLFDADGRELSRGALQPAMGIDAGKTGEMEIADANLPDAARAEVRKLP